jgi:hypothetical protein
MHSTLSQAYESVPGRAEQQIAPRNGDRPNFKEIPYDHVATFTLEGRRGNRVQDVINISVDGAFVAVAIGYSFIPARLPDLSASRNLNLRDDQVENLRRTTGAETSEPGLPSPATKLPLDNSARALLNLLVDPLVHLQCTLKRACGIDFKYSIIDSASGRELQNQPIHNIAGLGESGGERPFRPLAKQIVFQPRSTIRIEIEEISEGFLYGYDDANGRRVGAELQIVLHGYKILGYGAGLS